MMKNSGILTGLILGVLFPGALYAASPVAGHAKGGIVVALDFSEGPLLVELATKKMVIHGLVATDAELDKTRSFVKQKGLYGRVSCDRYNGSDLPYIDNLINVLLCKSTATVPPRRMNAGAGRSTLLDGGIAVFGLDPFTGEMLHRKMMQGPYVDPTRNFPLAASSGTLQLEGFKSGIFSIADSKLFIRNQAFMPDLTPVKPQAVRTIHLMASAGFLNDSPQHRTYRTVDQDLRYGGARRGRTLKPTEIYSIFSGDLVNRKPTGNKNAIPSVGKWAKRWNVPTPFAGHAIARSSNTLLAAGVPMLKDYYAEDTNASYAGKRGGLAWLLDAESGEKLQEIKLDAAPTWDGIEIARNNYFICLKDGSVLCYAGTE